jgi:hypothetical protein
MVGLCDAVELKDWYLFLIMLGYLLPLFITFVKHLPDSSCSTTSGKVIQTCAGLAGCGLWRGVAGFNLCQQVATSASGARDMQRVGGRCVGTTVKDEKLLPAVEKAASMISTHTLHFASHHVPTAGHGL